MFMATINNYLIITNARTLTLGRRADFGTVNAQVRFNPSMLDPLSLLIMCDLLT
jgi:hypothetical protein